MARGLYVVDQLPPIDTATRTTYTTFTSFGDVYGAPQKIIPKSRLDVGLTMELEAFGEYSTSVTPTLSIGFYFNGAASTSATGPLTVPTTILAQTQLAAPGGSGAAAWFWHAHWMGVLRAAAGGATGGTWHGMGYADIGTSLGAAGVSWPMPITQALRTVTCDVTADRAVGVGWQYGTSSASNTVTVTEFFVKLMS
jgi:hypothetical protein